MTSLHNKQSESSQPWLDEAMTDGKSLKKIRFIYEEQERHFSPVARAYTCHQVLERANKMADLEGLPVLKI